MAKCRIIYPKNKDPQIPYDVPSRLFVATGVVCPPIRSVGGILIGDRGTVAVGATLVPPGPPPARRGNDRWFIRFEVGENAADLFDLYVFDAETGGGPLDRRLKLRIRPAVHGVAIAYPEGDSENICPASFVAYGTRSSPDSHIVNAQMTAGGTTTDADYIFDNSDSGFWSAVFPPLPNGTYDLRVQGSANTAQRLTLNAQTSHCT